MPLIDKVIGVYNIKLPEYNPDIHIHIAWKNIRYLTDASLLVFVTS